MLPLDIDCCLVLYCPCLATAAVPILQTANMEGTDWAAFDRQTSHGKAGVRWTSTAGRGVGHGMRRRCTAVERAKI